MFSLQLAQPDIAGAAQQALPLLFDAADLIDGVVDDLDGMEPDDSFVACSAKASNVNVSNLRGNIDIRHFVTGGAKVVVGEDLR